MFAAAICVVVAFASPATTTTTTKTSTPAPPPGVVLDSSLGPVSIAETERQVLGLLGPPFSALIIALPGGKRGKLARYDLHGALFLT